MESLPLPIDWLQAIFACLTRALPPQQCASVSRAALERTIDLYDELYRYEFLRAVHLAAKDDGGDAAAVVAERLAPQVALVRHLTTLSDDDLSRLLALARTDPALALQRCAAAERGVPLPDGARAREAADAPAALLHLLHVLATRRIEEILAGHNHVKPELLRAARDAATRSIACGLFRFGHRGIATKLCAGLSQTGTADFGALLIALYRDNPPFFLAQIGATGEASRPSSVDRAIWNLPLRHMQRTFLVTMWHFAHALRSKALPLPLYARTFGSILAVNLRYLDDRPSIELVQAINDVAPFRPWPIPAPEIVTFPSPVGRHRALALRRPDPFAVGIISERRAAR